MSYILKNEWKIQIKERFIGRLNITAIIPKNSLKFYSILRIINSSKKVLIIEIAIKVSQRFYIKEAVKRGIILEIPI